MKKAQEYRRHAQECRVLARGAASDQERDQLLAMAAHWENLAEQRLILLQKQEHEAARQGGSRDDRVRGTDKKNT